MRDLKKTLDAGGHCVLEMPSGTGKTVSLLSLIVAYQMHRPEHRKLIYCSRTMSEIEKALAELKALMKYRSQELGYEEEFRALGLTSRKNLCLHPSVKREKSGTVVDARCRSLTAGFVKEKKERGEDVELCVYHEVCARSYAKSQNVLTNSRTSISLSRIIWFHPAFSLSTVYYGMEKSTNNVPTSLLDVWCVISCGPINHLPLLMQYTRCLGAMSSSTPTIISSIQRSPSVYPGNFRRTASWFLTRPTISTMSASNH